MTDRSITDRTETSLPATHWHTLSQTQIEQLLQTGPHGLTEAEARCRLARHGPNQLAPPRSGAGHYGVCNGWLAVALSWLRRKG